MNPRDLVMLLTLAALWGASFLFMRIGAPVLGPAVLIFLRVSIASAALLLYLTAKRQRPKVVAKWKQYLLLGLMNAAIPFSLISTAELHVTASVAAILNATTPLFTALVARIWSNEPLTFRKIGGLILGFIGVAVLVGWNPDHSGASDFSGDGTNRLPAPTNLAPTMPAPASLIPATLSLLAAVSYAFAGVYSSRAFKGERPMDMAIGQQLGASVIMIPLAAATMPDAVPSTSVILSVLGLAVLCTAAAYLLYFALIRNVGPVKTLSVTFLIPVFGIVWGVLFLGETVTPGTIVGLVIILVSVALVANVPTASAKHST